ncbi:MAG: AcvB/VirJ family lysyl-phosphatidylglycerol hydrolase [Pseudomonadota bacterium]
MTFDAVRNGRHWRWRSGVLLITGLLLAATAVDVDRHDRMPTSAVLEVRVPQGMAARSTALPLTGTDGWTAEHAARAARLSELHTLVIGVDGPGLLSTVGNDCAALSGPLSTIARHMQEREGALARAPVLAALPDAGDLALHAAMAGPTVFKGLVSESFGARPGLCGGPVLPEGIGDKAPVRWLDITQPGEPSRASALAGTKIVEAKPETGPRKAFYRSYLGVAGTDSSFDITMGSGIADLSVLPLTIHEVDGASPGDTYAIFLSGDGCWAKFDKEISDRLAARGIPVVGISSLRYMWREKLPGTIARDFARIDAHYREAFGRDRVLLLGFSLGANALPFAAAELPSEFRQRLAGVGLIAPVILTGFEIRIGGWLGQQTGAIPVRPAIEAMGRKVPGERIACLHGTTETVSACPDTSLPGMRSVLLDGGHQLGPRPRPHRRGAFRAD